MVALSGEPGPWATRISWLVLPFTVGPALEAALDPRSIPVRTVATLVLWAAWVVALTAALVPRTTTLTTVRTVMPAALPAAMWATTIAAPAHPVAWQSILAVTSAVVVLAAVMSPLTGEAFIDGSSYGPERRLALRAPSFVLVGPVQLAWCAVVGGTLAGPLLLAARMWVAGGVALVLGLVVAAAAVRALHGLARRWVVLVPAGLVLHDPLALVEPVLFPRRMVRTLGPAPADGIGAADVDVTSGAPGLALRLDLADPIPVALKGRSGRSTGDVGATAVLFTPTRPGELLRAAAGRRLPVG